MPWPKGNALWASAVVGYGPTKAEQSHWLFGEECSLELCAAFGIQRGEVSPFHGKDAGLESKKFKRSWPYFVIIRSFLAT